MRTDAWQVVIESLADCDSLSTEDDSDDFEDAIMEVFSEMVDSNDDRYSVCFERQLEWARMTRQLEPKKTCSEVETTAGFTEYDEAGITSRIAIALQLIDTSYSNQTLACKLTYRLRRSLLQCEAGFQGQ